MILRTEDIEHLAMRQKANVEKLLSSIGTCQNDFIKQKKAIDECLEQLVDIAFLNECKKKAENFQIMKNVFVGTVSVSFQSIMLNYIV